MTSYSVGVDYEKIRILAPLIRNAVEPLKPDPFTDERYYPPARASRRDITAYFLVMVAMDHRLSRPSRPYEGFIDGEFYHGADLLYRLGSKKFNEDPDFFYAERLSRLTKGEVIEWLSIENGGKRLMPPDVDVRLELLRDLGSKLKSLYGGDPYEVVARSKGYLRRGVAEGFIDRLKVFKAYNDPVEKKAFLLAKFLERRGVLDINDGFNKEVPVDNHLVRIAVRTGIISIGDGLREKIAAGIAVSTGEDVLLRMATRMAYKELSQASGIDPFILDDFLWLFGRRCCTREKPTCRYTCRSECRGINGCSAGCILESACKAASNPLYMLPEHRFIETWWY